MPQQCKVCAHTERATIESLIAERTPYRNIAEQFGVSPPSLTRHLSHILTGPTKGSLETQLKQRVPISDVLGQLRAINETTLAIMQEARRDGKNGTALFAIDRLQKQLELQAKLVGMLDERPQVDVHVTIMQQWLSLRTVIFHSLAPFPDARAAVAQALAQIEIPDEPRP